MSLACLKLRSFGSVYIINMGMFDTIQIHVSILKNLLPDEDVTGYLHSCEKSEGAQYFSFQTKSLDNFLDLYTLKEDGCLYKTSCKWGDNDTSHETLEVKTNLTSIVDFYDYFKTEKHFVSLEINMQMLDGKLSEIHVTKLDKQPIELHNLKHKYARLQSEYKESTWEMRVYRGLQKIEWKMWRFFKDINKYSKIKTWLTDRAKEKLRQITQEDKYDNL